MFHCALIPTRRILIKLACSEKAQKDTRYQLMVVHDEQLRHQILPESIERKA